VDQIQLTLGYISNMAHEQVSRIDLLGMASP
jgi:hypothetical protein